MNSCRGEDEGAPGVFTHGKGLVESPDEGVEVRGVRRGRGGLGCDGKGDGASRVDSREKPKGRRQLDSRRTRAAMSGKVAAIVRASG